MQSEKQGLRFPSGPLRRCSRDAWLRGGRGLTAAFALDWAHKPRSGSTGKADMKRMLVACVCMCLSVCLPLRVSVCMLEWHVRTRMCVYACS